MTNQSQPEPSAAGALRMVEEALDEVQVRANKLERAQAGLAEAKNRLYDTLTSNCGELSPDERVDVARRLYWDHPELNPQALAAGLGFSHENQMRSAIGPKRTGQTCDRCHKELMQRSRSAPPGSLCTKCEKAERAEQDADWESLEHARTVVLETPVTCALGVWVDIVDIVLAHPPAVAAPEWDTGAHLEDFHLAERLHSLTETGNPLSAIPLGQAVPMLRAAEVVAAWYPAAVDEIVESRLGPLTFSAVAVEVEKAITAAGLRAQESLAPAPDFVERDIRRVLAEFRPSPKLHPLYLLEGR